MVTEPSGLTLEMKCVVQGSPSLVFRAMTEPEELAKWWGPRGFTCPNVELDLQVGGSYRIAMQPPEGDLFHLSGEFTEVDPPGRLAYTFRWDPPAPDDQETVVTLTVRDLGESSEIQLVQGPFATEERHKLHDDGWSDAFERLQALVSPQP